jgi:F-box interacting protein
MERLREAEAKRRRTRTLKRIDIPDDVLEQVLLRLPVKSLMRFKSVCKSWRDTIGSPHFQRSQLLIARVRRPSMLILPLRLMPRSGRMDKIRFYAYPGHGTVAELMHEKLWSAGISSFSQPMHCDGLVVVAAAHSSHIFVCNPATKELVLLPAGSPDYNLLGPQKVGFNVDTSTGKYKVVRCFWRHCNKGMTEYSIGCEIFTLGSMAWKPLTDPPYLVKHMTPLCLPGAIYWSAGITRTTQAMLRFDLRDEEFTMFPAPPCMELADVRSYLTDMSGKLCYSHIRGHNVQLWMAEDDGVQLPKWLMYFNIVLPWPTWSMIPFSAYQGVIYLCLDLTYIYKYNTESGSLERVVNMNQEVSYVHPQGTLHRKI